MCYRCRVPDKFGTRARARWAVCLALAAIALGGAIVRVCAARGDLWLDEIWSLLLARSISSPLEILTAIHHDNNQYLNTLCLYLFQSQENWFVYRVPAICSGIATMIVIWMIGRRRNTLEAMTAMMLSAFSYLLVHYSSEARGYSFVLLFSLLTFCAANDFLRTGSRWAAVGFCLSCIAGFLSGLTFLYTYLATVPWFAAHFEMQRRAWKAALRAAALCHAVPVMFFALLYFVDIRRQEAGGGDSSVWSEVYLRAMALSLGVKGPPWFTGLAGLAAISIVVVGTIILWRDEPGQCVFFLSVILVVPTLLQLFVGFEFVYERHFLVCAAFLVLLLSRLLARAWRHAVQGKLAYVVILLAFLGCNGWQIARLLQYGRGDYLNTLRFMVDHNRGTVVTIGGDRDFRNEMIVNFYAPYLSQSKPFAYYRHETWPQGGTEWFLTQSQEEHFLPAPLITDLHGDRYELVKESRYAGLSGFAWFLYHATAVTK